MGSGAAVERRGMFLVSASPVYNRQGSMIGCLYGGILLNGNLALVDRIRDLVYGDETFERTKVGSATIRITSYNVCYTKLLRSMSSQYRK